MLAFYKVMPYSGYMNKAFEKACEIVGAAKLARLLDVSPQAVSAVKKGDRPVPIPWCSEIERATNGQVTRKDLRPDDWKKIWLDLESPCSSTKEFTPDESGQRKEKRRKLKDRRKE